jgi:hypothetical protein
MISGPFFMVFMSLKYGIKLFLLHYIYQKSKTSSQS